MAEQTHHHLLETPAGTIVNACAELHALPDAERELRSEDYADWEAKVYVVTCEGHAHHLYDRKRVPVSHIVAGMDRAGGLDTFVVNELIETRTYAAQGSGPLRALQVIMKPPAD